MSTPHLVLPVRPQPRPQVTEYQKERAAALETLKQIRRQERRRWIVFVWKVLRQRRGIT